MLYAVNNKQSIKAIHGIRRGEQARAVKNLSPTRGKKTTLKASLLHLRYAHLLPVGQGAKPAAAWCASHVILGQFPAPNPVEHFFEACKPRENPPHKNQSSPSSKKRKTDH
jgi:hypothetical protein